MTPSASAVFPALDKTIEGLKPQEISNDRKAVLQDLAAYIQGRASRAVPIHLVFVCTHNSRRSHFAQIWTQTLAHYFAIQNIYSYSGGTEATSLYPMVAQTLEKNGFVVKKISEGPNPVYGIKYAPNEHPVVCFSKEFNDGFNPKSDFAAIMTCDSANDACPFVPGAEKRFAITYADPKAFDHLPEKEEQYRERNLQIATEMYFVFSQIKR